MPADVPYTYTYTYASGPEGVEVLNIRYNPTFNLVKLSNNDSFWNKTADIPIFTKCTQLVQ